MHVFSRRINESLVIGNDITITVIDIRGDKVRLAIDSRPDMAVHRKEVLEAMRKAEASHPSPPPVVSAAGPPAPHFTERQLDKIDKFVAALNARSSVTLTRDIVVQALREAGLEAAQIQYLAK